jgi:proline iminopeptidase
MTNSPPVARHVTPAPNRTGSTRAGALVRRVEADRRLAWGAALLVAVAYGALAGWWTPRGPHSAFEALAAMGLGLLVGLLAAFVVRSRWVVPAAPVAFAAAVELVRLGVPGPTVDGVHLDSTYGILAFATGRGVHGLLALLPMVLGAVLGAALSRRRRPTSGPGRLGSWLRRGVAVVTAVVLVALAAAIARPASTDPIVDAAGQPVAGSVAELTRVGIGGHDLAMMIRGRSDRNPVLLFLAGGPGGSELGAMRRHSRALEDDFVVVTLDQRGTGRSYDQLDPAATLTLERAVADTLEVTEYLRGRFGQDRVYLAGQSWGSLLGVLAVQRRPELFSAFIGVGQMVSPVATDRVFYDDTLAWARASGDAGLVETLTASGPPPYAGILDYEQALSYEQELYPYSHAGNSEGAGQMGENILVEEYTLLEQLHVFAGFLDTFSVLYPQIQDVDLRTRATRLDVPVYLVQGAHEAPGRARPAEQWFALLDAPDKTLVTFDASGHRPLWEQPDRFHDLMATVLAETAAPR